MSCDEHVLIEAWTGEEQGLEVRYGNGRLSVFDSDLSSVPTLPLRAEKHPGVSVADLLEELELRDALWDRKYTTDRSERLKAEARVEELRATRESAKEPKFKRDQKVLVRAVYKSDIYAPRHTVMVASHAIEVDLDDICTEKP